MRILFYILLCLIFTSCKKDEQDEESSRGAEYAPTTEGLVREFEIIEVNRIGSLRDTNSYFLKERVGKSFVNGDEMLTELWRYKKNKAEESYDFDSLWNFSVTFSETIVTENFVRKMLLKFPTYLEQRFDENAFNINPEFNLDQEVGETISLELGTFSNCVKTSNNEFSNLIETNEVESYYAENIGLIYFLENSLSHQPGEDTTGTYFTKKLIATYFED